MIVRNLMSRWAVRSFVRRRRVVMAVDAAFVSVAIGIWPVPATLSMIAVTVAAFMILRYRIQRGPEDQRAALRAFGASLLAAKTAFNLIDGLFGIVGLPIEAVRLATTVPTLDHMGEIYGLCPRAHDGWLFVADAAQAAEPDIGLFVSHLATAPHRGGILLESPVVDNDDWPDPAESAGSPK